MPTDTSPPRSTTRRKPGSGPAPGRILAAAASISVGLGLVALMASPSAQPQVIVQAGPVPASAEMTSNGSATAFQPSAAQPTVADQIRQAQTQAAAQARQVQAATPAPAPVVPVQPITRTQGS